MNRTAKARLTDANMIQSSDFYRVTHSSDLHLSRNLVLDCYKKQSSVGVLQRNIQKINSKTPVPESLFQ